MYKSINISSYVKCFERGSNPQKKIRIRNDQSTHTRSFLLNEKSQKINYLHMKKNSNLMISDQLQSNLQLENVISTRRTPLEPTAANAELRVLLKESGKARIIPPKDSNWSGNTIIRLQSHISPNAVKISPEWNAENLGVNFWSVNDWPLELGLETGYYRLEAYSLLQNNSCNAVFEIRKDVTTEVICRMKSSDSSQSFAANLEIPQALHKIQNYTDKNGFQLPTNGADKETKIIWATSREHRLKFRVFPVSEDILAGWEAFKRENTNDSEFNLLGQFAIRLGSKVTRELLCPYSLTSEIAYLAAIRRVQPNALQIFGCDNLDFPQSKAIEVARKTIGTVPVILPATDNNPLIPISGYASFVSAEGAPPDGVFIPAATFESLSHESRYTLSRGAILRLNTPITNYVEGQADETAISFDLEVKAVWPFKVTGLEVQQSDGSVFKRKIEIEANEYAITKFRTTVKPGVKWLQLNLVGRVITEYPGLKDLLETDRVVASSAPLIIRPVSDLSN
jgi:hypothetical protein